LCSGSGCKRPTRGRGNGPVETKGKVARSKPSAGRRESEYRHIKKAANYSEDVVILQEGKGAPAQMCLFQKQYPAMSAENQRKESPNVQQRQAPKLVLGGGGVPQKTDQSICSIGERRAYRLPPKQLNKKPPRAGRNLLKESERGADDQGFREFTQ